MFNQIIEKIREFFRLSKDIKKVEELISLREASLKKHSKKSLSDYRESGIPTLLLNKEMMQMKRKNLFRKNKEKMVLQIVVNEGMKIADVGNAKGRKTRSDKGKPRKEVKKLHVTVEKKVGTKKRLTKKSK